VYGRLPEKVLGVKITAVDKRRILPLRLIAFTFSLWRVARSADFIFVENGASAELPALIVSLTGKKIILHIGDKIALNRGAVAHILHQTLLRHATHVITQSPPQKPEILPLAPRPESELGVWEDAWQTYLKELGNIFSHAN
jgi:hypothetical protein